MKRNLFKTTIGIFASCITIAPICTLVSCNKEQTLNQTVSLDNDYRLDYVYVVGAATKMEARYQLNLQHFHGGETVELKINSVHDLSGEKVDFVDLVTKTFNITKKQKTIPIEIKLTDNTKYLPENANEYTVTLSVTIKSRGLTKNIITGDLWVEVAKPTVASDFQVDENGVCSGFAGEDYKNCTFFALPETVTSIADNAFFDNDAGTTKIPSAMRYMLLDSTWGANPKLESIGSSAFNKAPFVGDCYIPKSVVTISKSAFYYVGFTRFYVGVSSSDTCSLTTIGDSSFRHCKFSGDCVIPEGVTQIGNHAFRECTFTGDYVLPKSLQKIGSFSFAWNQKTQGRVIFPEENASITVNGWCGFGYSTIVGDVRFPDSFSGHNIAQESFENCSHITSLSFPEGLDIVQPQAFNNCSRVSKLDFSRFNTTETLLHVDFRSSAFSRCGSSSEVEKIVVLFKQNFGTEFETTFIQKLTGAGLDGSKVKIEYKQ